MAEAIIVILGIIFIPIAVYFFVLFILRSLIRSVHLKSLVEREKHNVMMTNLQRPLPEWEVEETVGLCTGSVVFGLDKFASFLSSLKHLIGGRIRSFEEILERTRREAMVRLAEEAKRMGANVVINVRLESATLGQKHQQQESPAFVEIIAYGTALKVRNLR